MMSEQERVKKAIADRNFPEVVDASAYETKRFGMRRVDLNRMILGDFGSPLPPTPMFHIQFDAIDDSHIVSNARPERFVGIDFGREAAMAASLRDLERTRTEMYQRMMWGSYADFQGSELAMFGGGRSEASTAVLEPPPEMPRPSKEILKRFQVTDTNVTDMRAELAVEAETLLGYSVLRKRLGMHSPLTEALLKLEIEPFDAASVQEYKKQMLAYAQNEAARMDVAEGIDPKSWRGRRASWESHGIKGYSKPIPEFAIDTAIRIKKAVPEVEFRIEELTIVPDPFLIAVLGRVQRYVEVWDEPKFEGR